MLIAFLALMGVDLVVVVVLLVGVLARPALGQPAAWRVRGGHTGDERDAPWRGIEWRRGYGRWVREVLVWTKKPFLFRNDLVAVDRLQDARPARDGEIKRLGDDPVLIELAADGTVIQVAAHGEHCDLVLGPYRDRGARAEAADGLVSGRSPRVRSIQSDARGGPAPTGSNQPEDSR